MKTRYTTERVENALSAYIESCEIARKSVSEALTVLSESLCSTGQIPAVVQASWSNVILSTASQHASKANVMGWGIAELLPETKENNDAASTFCNVWPYWIDRTESVANSFELKEEAAEKEREKRS